MNIRAIAIICMLLGSPVMAADLTVSVVDQHGHPVAGAAVFAEVASTDVPGTYQWPTQMEQRDIQFTPYVLIVPVGASVEFPNRDRVRHHVYSFSKGNRFELELYGKEEKREISFTTPGIAAVGCNIHDGMIGFIRILDGKAAWQTGIDGTALLAGLPDDVQSIFVWHPDVNKSADLEVARKPGDTALTVTVKRDRASPVMSH